MSFTTMDFFTSQLKALIVEEPSKISVKDA